MRDRTGTPVGRTPPGALLLATVSLLLAVLPGNARAQAAGTEPLVSINPFPYDLTPEAAETSAGISREHGDLYTVQLDNGVPWQAALDGSEYPAEVMDGWKFHRESIGTDQPVFLAIAPLSLDRVNWAEDHGGKPAPDWIRKARRATPDLIQAYRNHVLRAVEYFEPAYLNIGVEAGDLAAKEPKRWPEFAKLYEATRDAVKAARPDLPIGISWGLPLLMKPGVTGRCAELIAASDYVGISYYPYLGEFYRLLGGASTPKNPPEQWREPYAWLRDHIEKPIAVCETAYSSTPVEYSGDGPAIEAAADAETQRLYVEDLAAIASRDDYLFVVFFLSVDYDELYRKLQIPVMAFWEHVGFFDEKLRPKPAWEAYQRAWRGSGSPATRSLPANPPPTSATASADSPAVSIPLVKGDLFQSAGKVTALPTDGMRWDYRHGPEWAWAMKSLPRDQVAHTTGLSFTLRSSHEGPLILQLEEVDGETHFAVLVAGQTALTHEFSYDDFQPDPAKKRNGVLDPGQLKSVMLADGQGPENQATGRRWVEISELQLTR